MTKELMDLVPRPSQLGLAQALAQLLDRYTALPRQRIAAKAQTCPAGEYLGNLIPDFEAYFAEHAAQTNEMWNQYVGLSRTEDVEAVVLPRIIRQLTRFAETGDVRCNYDVITQLFYLTMRSMLRQGELPSYFPLELLPSIPASNPE